MRYTILSLLLAANACFAQEVIWVRDGETGSSQFGAGIYPLGDQNDDGFDDWAVASSDGLDFFYGGSPPGATPYLSFRPRQNPPQGMHNYRTIGDVNGDGYEDWWVFYYQSGSDSVSLEIFGGGPTADTIPEFVITLDYDAGEDYGDRVGDHNGDGFDDFYYFRRGLDLATFYLGSANWNLVPSFANRGEPIGSRNSLPTQGAFGDFNGDGFDDYLTGTAPPNEHTYVFFGASEPDTVPDLDWAGNFDFPATLSADLNSDGAADLAVSRDPRTIEVHLGGEDVSPIPLFTLSYEGCNNVAHGIMSAGDYNGDGFEDLVIVNDPCDNGFGRLCLFLGGFWLNADPVLEITGLSAPPFDDVPIWRSVGLGDVNGDGIDDLAIACQGDILDGRRGRVVILSGDTTMHVDARELPPLAQTLSLSVYPNPANGFVRIDLEQGLRRNSEIQIYNLLGQVVDRLTLPSGAPSLNYDVTGLSTGLYLVQADLGTNVITQKLVVVK
ncbi:MAG: T9SS type A sorting domain-containing protein [Calditrichaeota bacterium]|nr:T9SS type A sorting domain-containing protein [Calditrichota bacterium]